LVPASVREVIIHMDGGTARVHISSDSVATLTGPAVFIGSISVSV
jgi:hypothetical protein